jgi:hypothetical protein
MKRNIFLQLNYETGPKVRETAFKQFRQDIKQWNDIKIIKELEPRPEVIIEFPDDKYQEVYDNIRQLKIVEVIDFIIPPYKI